MPAGFLKDRSQSKYSKNVIMAQFSKTKDSQSLMQERHHGQNIKRIRVLLGLSQNELATQLGGDWSAKRVSRLENSKNVQLRFRRQLANLFEVDLDLFDLFDEAASRMAFLHIMKISRHIKAVNPRDDQNLLEEINDLLDKAAVAIHRERQNMQLILRFLQLARGKTAGWQQPPSEAEGCEVKETLISWRVA